MPDFTEFNDWWNANKPDKTWAHRFDRWYAINAPSVEVIDPEPTWTFQPQTISDWDDEIKTTSGCTITSPVPGEFVMTIPPSTSDIHAELQASHADNGGGPVPCHHFYDWEFLIPMGSALASNGTLICQFHDDSTDPNSDPDHPTGCYTGGIRVFPDGRIEHVVRGGDTLGWSGGCQFAHDEHVLLGTFTRDIWHRLRVDAMWSLDEGKIIDQLDDAPPITTVGPTVGDTAKAQKFRLGGYGHGAGSTVHARNVKVA